MRTGSEPALPVPAKPCVTGPNPISLPTAERTTLLNLNHSFTF